MYKLRALTLGITAAIALGGCAVEPEAITSADLTGRITADLQSLFTDQEPIERPLSLYDAMARAVKYNLDSRVQLMDEALREGQLAVAKTSLLPQLVTNAGYSHRNKVNASSSQSVNTGLESLEPSTSSDKDLRNADVGLVWNVLDFGVSYARAQQQADEVLISREKRRKVIQNIIQDVRYAYWRAVSAERIVPDMDNLLARAEDALYKAEQAGREELSDPMEFLAYRKQLLELTREMWTLRQQLASAKTELGALLNLPPGEHYDFAAPEIDALDPVELAAPIDRLESYALAFRPELREQAYQSRISSIEVKKAMLRMLPGLEISLTGNYDSNSFLVNNTWGQFGVQLTWNIFNLFTGQQKIDLAEQQVVLEDSRRLSLSMAVLTQVHLARIRYAIARKDFDLTGRLLEVEKGIQKHTASAAEADQQNELDILRSDAQALVARLNHALSFAEMQNAYGAIHSSIGLDPLPEQVESDDLTALAQAIGTRLDGWEQNITGGQ